MQKLELSSPISEKRSILNALIRSFAYLQPYWQITTGSYLAVLVINALMVITPQLIRMAIDRGIDASDTSFLQLAVAALLGLTLLKGVLSYFQGRWTEIASQNVAYDLRNEMQRKLTFLSFSYHDRTPTGELLSRTMQDVERIRFLTGRASLRIVEGTLLLVSTSVVLIWMDARLGLLATGALPLLVFQSLLFGRRYRPLSLKIQQQLGKLTARLEQNLRGARIVKAFAQEEAEQARFDVENEAWYNLSLRATSIEAVHAPLMHLIANIGVVFILWYGGLLVIQNNLTVGELVAFTTYLAQLVRPIRLVGMIIPAVAMAGSAGERIFEILDAHADVRDAADAIELPPIRGRVTFDNVSFAYSPGREALSHIHIDAHPGQVIALLGPTGSGKSTIINLIPRFYDPTGGRVLLDGIDTRTVTLNSLRSQIGIVLQDTTLFATTISKNIAFGQPGASQEEIIAAARAAQAHDFIASLPNGYNTRVGERGMTLSGGQKQRLAIARALLTDPRILILDDATSSVDTETEKLIQKALHRLMESRTTFVIAHRLSTLLRADLILVMEAGRIAARGDHATLLHTSPLYAEIYERQMRPQERQQSLLDNRRCA
ncbi:MAG TPA: ABC transporter ATP-binding protein [Levilinea sp.]|nr:ABC transporter ATP-binding protein [Levilinea sp.]